MKLLEHRVIRDFGVEHQFLILGRRRPLIQFSVSLDDAPYYYLQLSLSASTPLSLFACFWRLSACLDILSARWGRHDTDPDTTDTTTDDDDDH